MNSGGLWNTGIAEEVVGQVEQEVQQKIDAAPVVDDGQHQQEAIPLQLVGGRQDCLSELNRNVIDSETHSIHESILTRMFGN
jgi:hypothetical protein